MLPEVETFDKTAVFDVLSSGITHSQSVSRVVFYTRDLPSKWIFR